MNYICSKCGVVYSYPISRCPKCQAPVTQEDNNKRNYVFNLGNVKITLNSNDKIAGAVEAEFSKLMENQWVQITDNLITRITNYDLIFTKGIPYLDNYMNQMAEVAHRLLLSYNVLGYRKQDFLDFLYNTNIYQNGMDRFLNSAAQVEDFVAYLTSFRQAQRSSRSRWQGGGFGFKGAIKGAINASIMNLGTNMIRSIGDRVTNSNDQCDLNKLKKQHFTALGPSDALVIMLTEMSDGIAKMIVLTLQNECSNMNSHYEFDKIPYLDTVLDNSIEKYRQSHGDSQCAKLVSAAFLKRIEAYPFDFMPYMRFVTNNFIDFYQLEKFIKDFNLLQKYHASLELYYHYESFADAVIALPERTNEERQRKIKLYEWLEISTLKFQKILDKHNELIKNGGN